MENTLKYEKEVNQLLRDLFYEDWMGEGEWQEFIQLLLRENKLSIGLLSKQIETGVNNGYSVDYQIKLLKVITKSTVKN